MRCPTQDAACEYENPNDCCNLHYNADGAGTRIPRRILKSHFAKIRRAALP